MQTAPLRRPPRRDETRSSAARSWNRARPSGSAVYGSTADEPEKHFLGWLDDVDPDELFDTGKAWGISVVRATGER